MGYLNLLLLLLAAAQPRLRQVIELLILAVGVIAAVVRSCNLVIYINVLLSYSFCELLLVLHRFDHGFRVTLLHLQ